MASTAYVPDYAPAAHSSKKMIWAGRIISILPILFLLMDGVMKVVKPQFVIDATVQLGFPESTIVSIGITLTLCTILYAIPQTAVLGAILLTGYLGGAVATHVRHGDPLFTHILFPVYVGVVVWLGLFLRDRRVRTLVPWRCIREKH